MKAVCGHTNLRAETRAAVEYLWPEHEFVDCRRDENAYHKALEATWLQREAFVVIEHDVVPDERVRDAFDSCGEPWCVFVGEISVGYTPGWLGCVRFHETLVTTESGVMTEAALDDTSGAPARAWWRCDVRVNRVLRDRGYTPHVHGRVQHLNTESRLARPDQAYIEFLERLLPAAIT